MAFKDKETAANYYRKYYQEKKKPKYVPHPRKLLTRDEKLAKKREWYHKNAEQCKAAVKRYATEHKDEIRIKNRLWVEKNKDYIKEYQKIKSNKWYKENKERHYKNGIIWGKSNPEKAQAIKRKFAENNPDKIQKYFENYNKKVESRYRSVKGNAKRRSYCFELSLEQYQSIIEQPCSYCGEHEKRIGVDRMDNTKGYTPENSTPCCTTCNMMKKAMTVSDFLEHTLKITNFRS